jgi:pimeloyl-ACP methyl ester carboxylesterase
MTSFQDLPLRELQLEQGTIRYREAGQGEAVVLVHGLLVNSLVWAPLVKPLSARFRVIAPDWPLGSHSQALRAGVDLSPPGLARLIADFIAGLGLEDVTLVGNDTGGALCQLVAVGHPERIARLVLTPCDAFENFPPPMFAPLFKAGQLPAATRVIAHWVRPRFMHNLPFTFGWLTKRSIDPLAVEAFLRPARSDAAIRRDLAAVLRGIHKRYTLEAAERFAQFDKPVLIAWAREDRFFKPRFAERLAAAFPNARLEWVDDSYTFVSVDQPRRLAELITAFVSQPATPAVPASVR